MKRSTPLLILADEIAEFFEITPELAELVVSKVESRGQYRYDKNSPTRNLYAAFEINQKLKELENGRL